MTCDGPTTSPYRTKRKQRTGSVRVYIERRYRTFLQCCAIRALLDFRLLLTEPQMTRSTQQRMRETCFTIYLVSTIAFKQFIEHRNKESFHDHKRFKVFHIRNFVRRTGSPPSLKVGGMMTSRPQLAGEQDHVSHWRSNPWSERKPGTATTGRGMHPLPQQVFEHCYMLAPTGHFRLFGECRRLRCR